MLSSNDLSTELLISQLLEEDLRSIEYGKYAEQLQLDEFPADSSTPQLKEPSFVDDEETAVRLFVQGSRLSTDAACAELLQHSVDVSNVASQQLAQKLAAAERKYLLDAEFAKRLQAADDGGEVDTDDPQMQDAERYLFHSITRHCITWLFKRPWSRAYRFIDGMTSAPFVQLQTTLFTTSQADDLNEKGKGKTSTPVADICSVVPKHTISRESASSRTVYLIAERCSGNDIAIAREHPAGGP
jgi:hypothetical protein